ncbi:MAG: ATP-binding cassette domain-containing protein [Fibrobacter sp.]|nr:ATP-binding cassette domain-containing protein [Fibrobacter sp.]
MVNLKDVSVSFKNGRKEIVAVKNTDITIQDGEIFGIVGTSGAGKSTLLRTINLLQKPSAGSVIIDGKNITGAKGKDLRNVRLSIGMVFQHFNLLHSRTVAQNIAFPLSIAGKSKKEIAERVPELLQLVGLSDKSESYPSQLSGGQKQRVGIARALANKPKILLCDEPTSALDLDTTNSILELLHDINRKLGITIIIISHEMAVIKKICSRVAVMSEGSVVESGSTFDIFANPTHRFTRQLVEHTLNLEIPETLRKDVNGKLVRVVYKGDKAVEPVLSDTFKQFNIQFNVLHGRIEYIGGQPLGLLLVNLNGEANALTGATEYIKSRTASTEVLYG